MSGPTYLVTGALLPLLPTGAGALVVSEDFLFLDTFSIIVIFVYLAIVYLATLMIKLT